MFAMGRYVFSRHTFIGYIDRCEPVFMIYPLSLWNEKGDSVRLRPEVDGVDHFLWIWIVNIMSWTPLHH